MEQITKKRASSLSGILPSTSYDDFIVKRMSLSRGVVPSAFSFIARTVVATNGAARRTISRTVFKTDPPKRRDEKWFLMLSSSSGCVQL